MVTTVTKTLAPVTGAVHHRHHRAHARWLQLNGALAPVGAPHTLAPVTGVLAPVLTTVAEALTALTSSVLPV